MPDALSRSQRRIVTDVMEIVQPDGFVIAGGIAMIAAGISSRPTHALHAISPTCDDVAHTAGRLIEQLRGSEYLVDVHVSDAVFAQMTVSTGKYRRTALVVELGRNVQLFESVDNTLGPMLSIRELVANTMLAASCRCEPRDLVDLHALADVTSLRQAVTDALVKDQGLHRGHFVETVTQTMSVRDDLWPQGSDPDAIARLTLLDPDLFD